MSPWYACLKGNLYQAAEQKAQIAEFETRDNTATKDTHDSEDRVHRGNPVSEW